MINVFSALTICAFVAIALFVLPGFAPSLEPKLALKRVDQLVSRVARKDCSAQMWPNFSVACLHGKGVIGEVRLIPARG